MLLRSVFAVSVFRRHPPYVVIKKEQLQCGQTQDKVTPPIPAIGAMILLKKSVLFLCECSKKCLSHIVETLSSVVLLGDPRPSLAGIGVPWVLTGTHQCALMPRVASRQSANPFVTGVVLKSWSWTWSERCVVVKLQSDVGTDNTCTPARLETLFTSSQFRTIIHDSRSKFPCERPHSQCFVKRSAVLCFVRSSVCVLSLSTVQALCNLAGAVLELLLDEICVPLEVSVST